MKWDDARLEELRFLATVDRDGPVAIQEIQDSPKKQMIASLLLDGYLNDGFEGLKHLVVRRGETNLVPGLLETERVEQFVQFVKGSVQRFYISHKGRVRLSELRQQLRTGRDRDETGLLWAKRHILTDLAVETLSAGQNAPLSLAFLDMNGLKQINDTHGHPAGDEAIRTFFQAVVATLGQKGEVYRNGGDEVVVLLPRVSDDDARKHLENFVRQLGKDVLTLGDARAEVRLTASCGSASITKPDEDAETFLGRADKVQYRAKEESKRHTPRVSAIAIGERPAVPVPLS